MSSIDILYQGAYRGTPKGLGRIPYRGRDNSRPYWRWQAQVHHSNPASHSSTD